MSTIANNINTYADITAYNADTNKQYPNVSYIQATDDAVMSEDQMIVATFNITDTTTATPIMYDETIKSYFTAIEIDGVTLTSFSGSYRFPTTGLHTVKYTLKNLLIADSCFQSCDKMVSIKLPNGISSIGSNAFLACTGLTEATLGIGTTQIGSFAFRACTSLTSITIPNGVTTIGQGCFMQSGLTSLTIPNSVTSIALNALSACTNLTKLTFDMTQVPQLETNTVVTTLVIGDNSTNIPNSAFYSWTGLTNVTIGSGVTSIGNNAFRNCSNLSSVTVLATTPPTLNNNYVFDANASGRKIYVPAESVNTYKAASKWSSYAADIVAINS